MQELKSSSRYYKGLLTESKFLQYLQANHPEQEIVAHRFRAFFIEIDCISFDTKTGVLNLYEVKTSTNLNFYSRRQQHKLLYFSNSLAGLTYPVCCQLVIPKKSGFSILPIEA